MFASALLELLNLRRHTVLLYCVWRTHASVSACASAANLFEVALLVGSLLGVLLVDDVQRRLPLLQLQAFDLRLQLVELLLQVFALLHVLHPVGDGERRLQRFAEDRGPRLRRTQFLQIRRL